MRELRFPSPLKIQYYLYKMILMNRFVFIIMLIVSNNAVVTNSFVRVNVI